MLLNSYSNGNCAVQLFSDGTKIRSYEGVPTPEYPESIDVKITDWCDAGCQFCHESSTTKGKHGDLVELFDVLKGLPKGAEIAIGGGHPMAHPDFDYFVEQLSNSGIICNVTVNEAHFNKELPRLKNLTDNGFIHGVGYSIRNNPCDWDYPHLVTHVIIGTTSPSIVDSIKFSKKVLLLGYKSYGKGAKYLIQHSDVKATIELWYRKLFEVAGKCKVSFDNLAITQLKPERLFLRNPDEYEKFYMGNDGTFTMYIDGVEKAYSKSSVTPREFVGYSNISSMFSDIRSTT